MQQGKTQCPYFAESSKALTEQPLLKKLPSAEIASDCDSPGHCGTYRAMVSD